MTSLAAYCLGTAAICALLSGTLAIAWAKSRAPWRFVWSVVLVWILIGTLPLSARSWEAAIFPADSAHFLATMIWAAPFIAATLANAHSTWINSWVCRLQIS